MAKKIPKDERSAAWARELANSLRAWCASEGVLPSKLVKMLGMSEGVGYSITSGRSMSTDISNYAKVYLWTGLDTADPRKVPPQMLGGALRGKNKPRAWTAKQFNDWLKTKTAQRLLKARSVSGDTLQEVDLPSPIEVEIKTAGRTVTENDAIASFLVLARYIAQTAGKEAGREVAQEVLARILPRTNQRPANVLLRELMPYVEAIDISGIRSWLKRNPEAVQILRILDGITSKDLDLLLPALSRQFSNEV